MGHGVNPRDGSALYAARVMHRRRTGPAYRFVYRVFYLLVDIDRLDRLGLRLFSHNRFNLLSLRDADYGDGKPLRTWAEQLLARQGIDLAGGRIRLLTLPRILGFAFNPINLWYCDHRDGTPRAVIAEVNNTFGEKHCYVLPAASDPGAAAYIDGVEKEKCFHVSPFLDRRGRYRFEISTPAQRLRVAIHESDDGQPVLDATLAGERHPLSDGALLRQVAAMPWMCLRVVWGIHWQALKLWLRGARLYRKPAQLKPDVS